MMNGLQWKNAHSLPMSNVLLSTSHTPPQNVPRMPTIFHRFSFINSSFTHLAYGCSDHECIRELSHIFSEPCFLLQSLQTMHQLRRCSSIPCSTVSATCEKEDPRIGTSVRHTCFNRDLTTPSMKVGHLSDNLCLIEFLREIDNDSMRKRRRDSSPVYW